MPESFDFVTADPGSGGANLAGDTFTQVSDSLFVPACYLVYGPAGGPYTRVDSGDGLPVEVQGTVPVSGTFWQATQPVSGPLTDAELRASAVVVSATNLDIRDLAYSTDSVTAVQGGSWSVSVSGTPTVVVSGSVAVTGTFWQATQPVSIADPVAVTGTFWQATQPVSGPLTDAQLRATPVPVSGTVSTGGLTNTELRSAAVVVDGSGVTQPVSGTFWQATQPVSGTFWQATQPVSGPLTDAELRATPVPVSGTVSTGGLTNTELRSTAVVVDGSGVTQPVSGTFWQATQPVSGTVGVSSVGGSVAVTGTFWQATQPVSAAALPLPSGASTAAKQPALGTAGTASADVLTVQGIASMTALKVDGSAVTQPVSGTVTVVDGGGSITVDGTVAVSSVGGSVAVTGTFWQATQPVSVASTVTVTGAGGTFPVTDSGGSLTVDGTVAATQSGTWAVSGPEAKDAAATANPLYLAGYGSTATPSSVSADGDITPLWVTRYGALWVVDVGAGTSATPSDAYAAGSMPPGMSFGMLFNGTTWDRARSVNTGQARATLYDASGNVIFPAPAALADGASNPTTVLLGSCESLWNGSTWDRRQGKEYATILASGTRNATTTTSTVTSRTAQGVIVYLNVTAYPGGGNTLNILLRSYDPVTNNVTTVYTSAASAIAAVGTYTFELCPGAGTTHPTTGCGRSPQPLPYKWDVAVVHATGAGNWTYSVNYQLVP